MRKLVDGQLSAPEFAKAWLGARRKALEGGERVREPFGRVLLDVFYLLEDYAIDPTLREEGDMSDAELAERVREALQRMDAL